MATLTNPGTLTDDSLNTFTASVDITLDASTTYWITVGEGISNRAVWRTASNDETGEPGWSIGNGRLLEKYRNSTWSTSVLFPVDSNQGHQWWHRRHLRSHG